MNSIKVIFSGKMLVAKEYIPPATSCINFKSVKIQIIYYLITHTHVVKLIKAKGIINIKSKIRLLIGKERNASKRET